MPAEPDRRRLASEELAKAKADAAAKGARPSAVGRQARERGATGKPRRGRRDDPEPLTAAISELIDSRGWGQAAAAGSVSGRWAQIVGTELAEHTRPGELADGELVILADSTAWATQLRLLAGELIGQLNAELGAGAVRRVKIRGPAGPARTAGKWRVRGGRGPRDTYG